MFNCDCCGVTSEAKEKCNIVPMQTRIKYYDNGTTGLETVKEHKLCKTCKKISLEREMVQLPPTEFTFSKYNMTALPWTVIKSAETYYKHLLALNIVGYCNSGECEIRPRPDDMAVMLEDENGYQSWTHVPKDIWNEYLKRIGARNENIRKQNTRTNSS